MYLNPLVLDGHHVGFNELIRGQPQAAITFIQQLVARHSANEETSRAAYRYMLMYATYCFPHLTYETVAQLVERFAWVIEDPGSRNLILERLNARWRLEQHRLKRGTNLRRSWPEKVYCVASPRFDQRRDAIKKSAALVSCPEIEFFGVDASTIEKTPKMIQFDTTNGAIAVIIGNLQVWQDLVDRRIPYAIVLEDDVTICDAVDCNEFLDEIGELDLIFLNNRVVPNYSLLAELPAMATSTSLVPVWFGCGADGYLVTRSGAEKLLELFSVAYEALDVQIMAHLCTEPGDEEKLHRCRENRNSAIRLNCKRTYPFKVDHPPLGYSSVAGTEIRHFCPGLWGGEERP